ncbi:hypothetical protein [Jeotgalibacillus marinus]|uniref:Uncharacterized protein n=1 Tax=Jeotgalibacillus marinus TaxID=86667 RepID=A0ABV3Q2S8_9BACL
MYNYNVDDFRVFMLTQYGIEIDEKLVGEESVLLHKDELDDNLVSEQLLDATSEKVVVNTCVYETEENEWMFCVALDADTNHLLFLICLKDGERVYGEILKDGVPLLKSRSQRI